MRFLAPAALAGLLIVIALPVAFFAGTSTSDATGPAAASSDIPPQFVPVYRAAAEAYRVPWLLLAAIHERETTFSTLDLPGVKSGANGCGAAGPMQFGVVHLAPYNATAPECGALTGLGAGDSWNTYKNARDRLDLAAAARAAISPPPSCRRVPASTGCVYDDVDAIAGAAAYLHDLGAGPALDDSAWQAAKSYNGGADYADAVMARARLWASEAQDDASTADPTTDITPGSKAKLRSSGLADAPSDAPAAVVDAIAAANEISDRPYAEVHWPTHIGNPSYDCSSSTSHVLWGAHVFGQAPWVSAQLATFGEPGPGRWITVYANDGHAFVVVAGLRFDTARYDRGPNHGESGPRWRVGPRPTNGFAVRHPAGL